MRIILVMYHYHIVPTGFLVHQTSVCRKFWYNNGNDFWCIDFVIRYLIQEFWYSNHTEPAPTKDGKERNQNNYCLYRKKKGKENPCPPNPPIFKGNKIKI